MLNNKNQFESLTKREIEVMEELVISGCAKTAAQTLNISKRTVETHAARIKEKLKLMYKYQFNKIVIENMYQKRNYIPNKSF